MSSFLGEVRKDYEDLIRDAAEKTWKEVVEPALKKSFKNGVLTGSSQEPGRPKSQRSRPNGQHERFFEDE